MTRKPKYPAPPGFLEGGRLLAYATVDTSVVHSSRSTLYVDGKLLGPVPRLAAVQIDGERGVVLLFCDERWKSLGAVDCESLEAALERAEREYQGLRAKWIMVSDGEVTQHVGQQGAECSFCGKTPHAVEQMFTSRDAAICDGCIRAFYADLEPQARERKP